MRDPIERQDAIDALRTCYDTEAVTYTNGNEYISYDQALDLIETLPSAQRDCTECPEYDTERHYCPKYCDVIKQTLEEAKQERVGRWIVVDDGCISGKCSVCGWEAHMYEDDVFGMDYCPNCGSRLEENNG